MPWPGARAYTLRRVAVPVLPPGSPDLRSCTSATCTSRRASGAGAVAARAGLPRPDLVVDTGDNMAPPRRRAAVLESYGELLAALGVFVFGSNDYSRPRCATR